MCHSPRSLCHYYEDRLPYAVEAHLAYNPKGRFPNRPYPCHVIPLPSILVGAGYKPAPLFFPPYDLTGL